MILAIQHQSHSIFQIEKEFFNIKLQKTAEGRNSRSQKIHLWLLKAQNWQRWT